MVVAVACQVLGPGDTADTEGPLPSEALHSRVGMGVLKKSTNLYQVVRKDKAGLGAGK